MGAEAEKPMCAWCGHPAALHFKTAKGMPCGGGLCCCLNLQMEANPTPIELRASTGVGVLFE